MSGPALRAAALALAAAAPALWAGFAPAPLADYVEEIPATGVTFAMVAVTPPAETGLRPFWIGANEVTWDEYEIFYFGDALKELEPRRAAEVDAVSRPTPPYGNADRGFGTGKQPAIGITHHAARQYSAWLSAATGRLYRLPTEVEWTAACDQIQEGADGASGWFSDNSGNRPHAVGRFPGAAGPIFDLLGNVAEFTSTPWEGGDPEVYVLKGGSYRDRPRSCRDRTPSTPGLCLATDPQIPKSRWWYSDCFHVGFRVVRESAP